MKEIIKKERPLALSIWFFMIGSINNMRKVLKKFLFIKSGNKLSIETFKKSF